MGYIDIHTHIIPGIDDGSKNNQESVEMLKQAYAAGVTTLIATPHFSKGFVITIQRTYEGIARL